MAGESEASVVQLAQQLCDGFAALSGEYQVLFDQQRQLESKLSWAKQQYLELLKRFTPSTLSQDHLAFLQELEVVGSEQPRSQWIEQLSQSDDVERKKRAYSIKTAELAAETFRGTQRGVKIWSGPSADKEKPSLRVPPARQSPQLEKDFTTDGTPSKLGCPFASGSRRQSPLATPRSSTSRMSLRGRRSKRPSFTDPIRAEICGNDMASASESIEGSAAVCPIRFLDQHDPAEVAKYFENHKHEIPRSHEVCIKRFQSNAEGIQQLDRKYGNLVSMIQGLGEKHQEFLPPEPQDDELPDTEAEGGAEGQAKVENRVHSWAEEVSASLEQLTPEKEDAADAAENTVDDARTAHFDRPLKEIRVGESPSRPWGISIPTKYEDNESSSSVGSVPTASPRLPLETSQPIEVTPQKPSKCPFDHRALNDVPDAKHTPKAEKPELPAADQPNRTLPSTPQGPAPRVKEPTTEEDTAPQMIPQMVPQMVFNGPVFFGYPPDQLMALLQNSNLGGSGR